MPSVASEPNAVQSSRPHWPSTRGQSRADGNAPESPFSQLLDHAAPAADEPLASRPERQKHQKHQEHQERTDRRDGAGPAHERRADAAAPAKDRGDAISAENAADGREEKAGIESKDDTETTDNTAAHEPAEAGNSLTPVADAATSLDKVFDSATPIVNAANSAASDSTPHVANAIAALSLAPGMPEPVATGSPEAAQKAAAGTPVAAAVPAGFASSGAPTANIQSDGAPVTPGIAANAAAATVGAKASAAAQPDPTPKTNTPMALHAIGPRAAPDGAAKPAGERPAQAQEGAEVKDTAAGDPRAAVTQIESRKDGESHEKGENPSSESRHTASSQLIKTEADAPDQRRQGDASGAIKISADAMQNPGAWTAAGQANAATAPMNTGANAATPTPAIAVPVAGLAVEIATQARAGNHHFDIRLDPPELGRIVVQLDIDRDGNVTSRLVADRADTLDLLKRDASQLERALQQAGLKTSDNALEFSLRQQGFTRDETAPKHSAQLIVSDDDDLAPLEALKQGYGRLLGQGAGLDITV